LLKTALSTSFLSSLYHPSITLLFLNGFSK
jgi:hypothetical protein